MYKFYMVPDATILNSHSEIYLPQNLKLFWDPYAENDAYGIMEPLWKEELNKAESIEFTVLPSNIHYNDFHKKKTVIVVFDEDEWLFEGVVTDAPIDFYKQRKVTAVSPLSYLCDSVQAPDEKNVIEIPVATENEKRYLSVPEAWYSGANPKGLNWYEQNIVDTYEPIEQTDVYKTSVTYYIKNENQYVQQPVTEETWNPLSPPQLYIKNGEQTQYVKSNDTSVNSQKRYFYEFNGDGLNYSGLVSSTPAATKETIIEHIKRFLNVHNSQMDPFKHIKLGNVYNANDTEQQEFKSSGYRTTWDALKSDILDEYGRYFTITRNNSNELLLNYIELSQIPRHTDSRIEFANNMIEMTESENEDDDVFTVLIPTGKKNVTLEKIVGHDSPAYGNDSEISPYVASFGGNRHYIVVSPKAVKRYGYIFKPVSLGEAKNANELYDKAVKYIKNNYDFHTEYDVKAVDLHFINGVGYRIRVGDRIQLHSKWHGVDTNELYVISAEHNLIEPENDSYKIGIPTSDREAFNRTLTGQSNKSRSDASAAAGSAQSAIDSFAAKLSALMDITEWGIKAHTRIENIVNSSDQMYLTKFLQTEYDLNLAAQKIFGLRFEDDQQQDAGYIKVPTSEYKSANGSYKNPTNEHWYEYVYDSNLKKYVYQRSVRSTCNPSETNNAEFYIQRLWTRYSDINVGPGGIKARVDGNYERSTANSSWISMNEDAITALTGHLFVDKDGHVYISSGSGMQTDHQEEHTSPAYFRVPVSKYKDSTGNSVKPFWGTDGKQWYERKVDSAGAWIGQNKEDSSTNDNYYEQSKDETADFNKVYFYKSYIRETFDAELGVYDENNLTAGILARTINNPTYRRVEISELNNAISSLKTLGELKWFVYDANTGLYGVPLDTTKYPSEEVYKAKAADGNYTGYYVQMTNSSTYTNIMGDHIVIGGRLDADGNPIIYDGVDEETKARIQRYIDNNTLDGTITEVASDVLYAKSIVTNRFEVLSKKIFGTNNSDTGYTIVKASGVGSDANPSKEGWYEKVLKEKESETDPDEYIYILSPDVVAAFQKDYYISGLTSRVTNFVVGEDGINGTVTGNYSRSIASAAWIKANEEKLEMLLGHVGEDSDGNLVIDSGAGFRSGYKASSTITERYVLVKLSEYAGANPSTSKWYVRKIGADGRWAGDGKSDSSTNSEYYTAVTETSSDYTKQYYKKSNTAEMFNSEYGIYDQGSLTAGIVAQMVNNPTYRKIILSKQDAETDPSKASTVKLLDGSTVQSMWYVYDKSTGSYGRTTDTAINTNTDYYYVTNSAGTYTQLNGEHIVIGKSSGYNGLDQSTKDRVNKYITGHNLDGTITEIASDVVTVNTLIAKYIDVDEITVNTYLSSENGHFSKLRVGMNADASNIEDGDLIANSGEFDELNGGHTKVTSLTFSPTGSSVGFGFSGGWDLGVTRLADPGDIIMGFGDISTSGDTVTIPFTTLYDYCNVTEDTDHVLSFEKPASIGRAVWSSGSGGAHDLKVYTVGGWNEGNSPQWAFYHARVTYPTNYLVGAEDSEGNDRIVYNRNGSNIGAASSSGLSNKPTIKAHVEISGDDYDRNGNSVAFGHDVSDDAPVIAGWSKYIFIDASQAFDDGKSVGKVSVSLNGPTKVSNLNPPPDQYEEDTINALTSLSYGTPYSVYLTSDGNVYKTRKFFKTPGKGAIRTYASNGQEAGTINLGYNDSVTIRGQRKMDGDNNWDSAAPGITVNSPSLGSVKTYYEYDYDGNGDAEENTLTSNRTLTLNYSDEVPVKGRYQDGLGNWHEGYVLTVKSRSDRLSEGRNGTTISSPVSTTAPSGVTPIDLTSYGTVYEVHKIFDSTNDGGTIYFRTPNDNSGGSGAISTNDIQLVSVTQTTAEPSDGTPLTVLRDTVIAANRVGTDSSPRWVSFTIEVGNLASKKYKMRFPPQQ